MTSLKLGSRTTQNPMAPVMKAVRDIIMFEYYGIMCYFNWPAKKQASLIFPDGRSIPGCHPDLEDGSNVQRMMYFTSITDVETKADGIRSVIDAYVASR